MQNKDRLNQILISDDVSQKLKDNQDELIEMIPEIGHMVGFKHNHPHHHLDVWGHTLEVVKNLNTRDLELNMAGLLHDIGKPFSYQDEEVRHFHGHPEVSSQMTRQILTRLGYDTNFINRVNYLVARHDTIIDVNNLDNSRVMIEKLLRLQYADARAHHPAKVGKRIAFLDDIKRQLEEKYEEMER
ncbi:MAG: HD domain-containing protein [Clostridia bacterium]|nr:HD domain-containing protein [Clostridia bacterium]